MANQNTSEIQSSYSQEIEFEKLKNLTDLFINKFGHRPTSFRAGRFGAGNNTISALENLGLFSRFECYTRSQLGSTGREDQLFRR